MELKARLNKPYTDNQKMDFVVKQNHQNRYEIKETDSALEAWGCTQEELEAKEKERIAKLTCTKRVFALMLQELGITYAQLKELIATNEQAQLEWDLCVELLRNNPLLDIMANQLGITSEQLDGLFKYANGEITIEDFRALISKEEPSEEETLNQVQGDEEAVQGDSEEPTEVVEEELNIEN